MSRHARPNLAAQPAAGSVGGAPVPSDPPATYSCRLFTCSSSSIAYRPFSRPWPDCL
jgi:hypothetical protein